MKAVFEKIKARVQSMEPMRKKRLWQALGLYLFLLCVLTSWIATRPAPPEIPPSFVVVELKAPPGTDTATAAQNSPENTGDGKKRVAIIISNLGGLSAATEKSIALPADITLAFNPYAASISDQMKKAVGAGHETLLLLPMDSTLYPDEDAGAKALSARAGDIDNAVNLDWALKQGPSATGTMNLMGSLFLSDKQRLSPIFDTLKKRSMVFIENQPTMRSAAREAAKTADLAFLTADLQIDNAVTKEGIEKQLARLESLALSKGYAIGVAEPYPMSLEAINVWQAGLSAKGITLAPVTAVWKNRPRHDQPAVTNTPAPAESAQPAPK